MKYLQKRVAAQCPAYQDVVRVAKERLESDGAFSKKDVIEELRYQAIEEHFRWDHVRSLIEDEIGTELIPVSSLYFRAPWTDERKSNPIDLKPEKYEASGYGKRTAGFVLSSEDINAPIAYQRIIHKEAQAKGTVNSLRKSRKNATERGAERLKQALMTKPQLELKEIPAEMKDVS